MSSILTISDRLYSQLEQAAQQRGLSTIEQLLEIWQARDEELKRRQQIVARIDLVREHMATIYGEMPDSVTLLREDRAR